MSNYTITTDFGAKDSLPSGNAAKVVKGSEFTAEFTNIQTAIATKLDLTSGSATNLTTTGTLTNSGAMTTTGVSTFNGAVNFASTTAHAGNATFSDNAKAIFGAGADLQIYHDGTDTHIVESGAGSLKIKGNFLQLLSPDNEKFFEGQANGASSLFYNGVAKLDTSNNGIDVTGTATMDGLTVAGNTGVTIRSDAVGANEPKLVFDNDTFSGANFGQIQTGNGGLQLLIESPSTSTFQNRHQLLLNGGGNTDVTFKLSTDNGSTYKNQLKIDNNDISFYEDTGTTPKFFWDSSAESLGIGTTSPTNTLTVRGASTTGSPSTGNVALFQGPSGTNGLKIFVDDTENAAGLQTIATDDLLLNPHGGNVGIGTTNLTRKFRVVDATDASADFRTTDGTDRSFEIDVTSSASEVTIGTPTSHALVIKTDDTEHMRIDSSGNVGIGTDSPTEKLDIDGDSIRLRQSQTPASASATGSQGQIAWDANYMYVCTATNTWKRVALATW